jgi:CRP/FNR family transcriptional regulator
MVIMPSAQKSGVDELASGLAEQDLYSLMREFHGFRGRNLNSLHGRGKVLFAEGEPSRGVYILRTGRATVSISSSEGRVVILRMAQAGDVLGMTAALQDSCYETTVKTLEPCRTDFISRAELMDLIEKSDAAKQEVLRILSNELTELTNRTRSLLLPQTASGRLARLLLEWCNGTNGNNAHAIRLDKVFTHEEIAQMICSSRETVTRLLAIFSRRRLIDITADSILINQREALEQMTL